MQRPELVSTEAQLAHSTRKLNNAIKSKQGLSKNETLLQTKVTSLQQELASVTKAAERAQGALSLSVISILILTPYWYSRGTSADFRTQCGIKRKEFGRISSTVGCHLACTILWRCSRTNGPKRRLSVISMFF
jgi:hypothetical protein